MYLHHEPCPECGSKDNLARYADGGAFCFGCHYTERANRFIPKADIKKEYEKPPELNSDFSPECVAWIQQYGLSLEELLSRGCGWNDQRQQLVFTFEGTACWQARNFNEFARTKYFTQGDINELIPIYGSGHNDGRLVVVEDCVSAIKCARQIDSMPILGSHISLSKIFRLSKAFHTIFFWLDADKLRESRRMSDQAALLGVSTKVIWTEVDPKEVSDEGISKHLGVGQCGHSE